MTQLRFCDSGGLLVYARGRLPDDPSDHHLDVLQAPSGCNRMRCAQCQSMVRSAAGRGLVPGVSAATLYAAEDWMPLTVDAAHVRLYACRCTLWESQSDAEVIDATSDSPNDPRMPWSCAGHPVPELPTRVGAFELAEDADWSDVVARVLGGECPSRLSPSGDRVEGPSLWLGWLYAYLRGAAAAEKLSSAIAARFDDADGLVRGRVRHFFARFPNAAGGDVLLDEAAKRPAELLVGYAIPEHYTAPTLFDVVVARLEAARKRGTNDARALEVLKQTMLAPRGSGEDRVEVALQRFSAAFDDAELHHWIADNVVPIEQAAPGRWRAVMDLLSGWYRKPALGHLIVIAGTSLLQRRAVAPAEFVAWMESARARHRWVDEAWLAPLRSVAASLPG